MDITRFSSNLKKLENPVELLYIFGGPDLNFWGKASGTSYRVGGKVETLIVDGRDVEQFLSLNKRGRFYFALNVESGYFVGIDWAAEELFEAVDHQDDFTIIDGIGQSTNEKIHNSGVHMFEDLKDKGVEWFSELPRINLEKANSVFIQLDAIIEEYRRM